MLFDSSLYSLVEIVLIVYCLYILLFQHKYNPLYSKITLTKDEINELVSEYEPEPLTLSTDTPLTLPPSTINSASQDYFSLSTLFRKQAISTLNVYGVGACGPPGFYGTLDIHMLLENTLASYLSTSSAILYSQGFATVSSAIAAFCKKSDVLVSYSCLLPCLQVGVDISKATLHTFTSLDSLDSLLTTIPSTLNSRHFLLLSTLSSDGTLIDFRPILTLKRKHKYRLILYDPTIGLLDKGIAYYFYGLDYSTDVDLLLGDLSGVFGAGGGFCAGSAQVVDHQRLSGLAYCFSAAMPAILAGQAICSIEYLSEISGKSGGKSILKGNTALELLMEEKSADDSAVSAVDSTSVATSTFSKKSFPLNLFTPTLTTPSLVETLNLPPIPIDSNWYKLYSSLSKKVLYLRKLISTSTFIECIDVSASLDSLPQSHVELLLALPIVYVCKKGGDWRKEDVGRFVLQCGKSGVLVEEGVGCVIVRVRSAMSVREVEKVANVLKAVGKVV